MGHQSNSRQPGCQQYVRVKKKLEGQQSDKLIIGWQLGAVAVIIAVVIVVVIGIVIVAVVTIDGNISIEVLLILLLLI
jgi:hypothetical protein